MSVRAFAVLSCLLALAAASPSASARDDVVRVKLSEVLAMPEARGKLDGSVRFYLAGQSTPAIAERLGDGVSNPKTNGVGKTDEYGCKYVVLSALIQFQKSAKAKGANAVVDLVSYYKKNETRSSSTIECHAGAILIGAALKGDYAKLAR